MKRKSERRQFAAHRVPARIEVRVPLWSDAFLPTENVSQSGVLVRSPALAKVDDQVDLEIKLPKELETISVVGRVARVLEIPQEFLIGIQLLEIQAEHQGKWLSYINKVESLAIKQNTPTATSKLLQQRLARGHNSRRIVIQFDNSQKLEAFYHDNLQDDRLFLAVSTLKTPGDRVEVILVHPETEKTFTIHTHIGSSRTALGKKLWAQRGLSLEFKDLDRNALQQFIGLLD